MAESKGRDVSVVIRKVQGLEQQRQLPLGSPASDSHNALSFLERKHGSSRPPEHLSEFPAGYIPRKDSGIWTTHMSRSSNLAFLERPRPTSRDRDRARGVSTSALVAGAVESPEAGLGWLGGDVIATSSGRDRGRGGFLTRSYSSSEDSDDELMDSSICPSMLFACFPCFSWFRPSKRPWQQPDLSFIGSIDGNTSVGNLGSNISIKRKARGKNGLGSPLLADQPFSPSEFPKDVKLIEVEVESAKNLPLDETVNMAELAGTYAILRITPGQEGVGEQAGMTSVATRPGNPTWGGRETFTFFVTDTGNSQAFLALQVLYRPLRPPPLRRRESSGDGSTRLPAGSQTGDLVIGEGLVDLLELFPVVSGTYTPWTLKGNARRVAVPLREPDGKKRTKCSVMLGLRCRRVNETIDTHEDRIYEYERWTRVAGWSTAGKRGEARWSTVDGSVLSDKFSDVAPPARADAEVVLPWCPFGGWEYSTLEERSPAGRSPLKSSSKSGERDAPISPSSAEGWENFSVAQKGTVWMESYAEGNQAVRRRLWRRVYLNRGSPSKAGTTVVIPPPA